jgi:hypothetical protein
MILHTPDDRNLTLHHLLSATSHASMAAAEGHTYMEKSSSAANKEAIPVPGSSTGKDHFPASPS